MMMKLWPQESITGKAFECEDMNKKRDKYVENFI